MFIQLLVYSDLKHISMLNYILAIKSQLKWVEIPSSVFDHTEVKLAQGGGSLH